MGRSTRIGRAYTQISPPVTGAPDDDTPTVIFIQKAISKFGKPLLAFKYPESGTKEVVWCPDGTAKDICKNTIQYQVANPPFNRPATNHDVSTPPTSNYVVLFAHKTADKTAWYEYVAIFDLTHFSGGPSAKPQQPASGIQL